MPQLERIAHPLTLRVLTVAAVTDPAPRLRRIVFRGDLSGFVSAGFDDHVKLIFPPRGEREPRLPELGERGLRPRPGEELPPMRDFTPRDFDAEAGTMTIEFVLHGTGPAAEWAAAAQPGDRIGQAGPRGSRVLSGAVAWWLLGGDEVALPAIGRKLAELPAAARAVVVCEVEGPGDELPLPSAAAIEMIWVHRGTGTDAVTAPTALERQIAALELPPGAGFAWFAAEAEVARRLRAHLREQRGLPRQLARVSGYWRRGVANHHDPPEPEAPAGRGVR